MRLHYVLNSRDSHEYIVFQFHDSHYCWAGVKSGIYQGLELGLLKVGLVSSPFYGANLKQTLLIVF